MNKIRVTIRLNPCGVAAEFKRGRSLRSIARKYGMALRDVEDSVRKYMTPKMARFI